MIISLRGGNTIELPASMITNLKGVHGEKVHRWLASLPALLDDLLVELNAAPELPLPELSYSLVLFATGSSGEKLAIKCTVPNEEFTQEFHAAGALSMTTGPSIRLAEPERGVLVLERVLPGTPIDGSMPSLASDAKITELISTLAGDLAQSIDTSEYREHLPDLRRWTRALSEVDRDSSLWRFHASDIERAGTLRAGYISESSRPDVFLHGDLHHANVLLNGRRGWRIIDPHGAIGHPGFEFGPFAYNPLGIYQHPELSALLRQRIAIWSRVSGIPEHELRDWGYIAAVLSACWSAEDHGEDWRGEMAVATTLRDLDLGSPIPR